MGWRESHVAVYTQAAAKLTLPGVRSELLNDESFLMMFSYHTSTAIMYATLLVGCLSAVKPRSLHRRAQRLQICQ